MNISLDGKLVETATKITTTINENGDINYGSGASVACLYRDISRLNQVQNRNEVTTDGILWFDAGTDIQKGDIYYHPSEGYLQIEEITRAKRLVADDSLQFIRTEVTKQRQVS